MPFSFNQRVSSTNRRIKTTVKVQQKIKDTPESESKFHEQKD